MSKYDKILEEIEKRKYFILDDDPGDGWSKYSTWFKDKEATKIQKGAIFNENKHSLIFTTFNTNIENKQRIGDKIYYTNIEEYEDSNPPWYDDIKNIQIVKFKIKIKPKTCSFWFYNGANIIKIENLYNLDTSDVTNMDGMFADCRNLTSLDLSSFDTSNVTTMFGMFINCFKLSYLDISGFDTSNVNNMMDMFTSCYSLKALDLSNFDTSKTLYIKSMFSNCESLTSLDLSNFDISKVTDLRYMFNDCQNLTSLDLSNFDTFNVTNMEKMFQDCSKLESINVSNLFNVSNVRIGEDMFLNCYSLVGGHGTVYNWEHTGVEYAVVDYYNESQKSGYFSNKWITPKVAYASYDSADKTLIFFRDKEGKYEEEQIIGTKTYYTGVETINAESSSDIHWNAKDIQKVKFKHIIKPESCAYWFCKPTISSIENIELLDTSNVTNMRNMFTYCSILTQLDVSNFNTSNVTDMRSMFEGCKILTQLDVSNFDTSNVTDMKYMFKGCANLTQLDLSNFDTSNVTNMSAMFEDCYNLTTALNIMEMPTEYDEMFYDAAKDSGQITLRYFNPVTREQAEMLKATENEGNVIIEIGDIVTYAVYDSSDNSLTIFRDEKYKYENEQVIDTKTYYAGIEDITGYTIPKWYDKRSSVTKVTIEGIFRPKTACYMFYGMRKLNEIEGMENLDTSECTKTNGMFYDCNNLTELDVSRFDTSKVTRMGSMFAYCYKLTELDLSHFDTSKVIDMDMMFYSCYKLTATFNIMNMPSEYSDMCFNAAKKSGQITLKYISPVTSDDIDTLVATKEDGNVINGGQA